MTKIAWRGLVMGFGVVALQSFLGGFPTVAGTPQTADSARTAVRATIVRPFGLENTSDMNFGTVLANDSGGTMSLFPSGAFTALGVTLSDETNVKPGKFRIFGTHSQAYSITLPRTVIFAGDDDAIRVVTFIHDAGGTPTLDDDGKGLFNLGATLRIGAHPSAGTYNGSVDVIISNY
jgi:hypothetical protein